MINKWIIQNNFSQKASTYNDLSIVQKNAAQKLCDLAFARNLINNNSTILDLGSGTSFIAKNLLQNKKDLEIFEVDIAEKMLNHWTDRPENVFPILADIENLPFKNPETFDAVFSSFALQWIENFEELFAKLYSLLKPNGLLIFCFPTEKTFIEIKEANKESGCNFEMRELVNEGFVKNCLLKSNFKEKLFLCEVISQKYQSATMLLKGLKRNGSNYSQNRATKKPVTKKNLQKFNDFFSQNSNNVSSWNICYLIYQK